ncbi:MAG: phosphoketolase family protein [Micrococcales bacterium]|nr:phosphoketolase family protein [Micrococcales bacterium]
MSLRIDAQRSPVPLETVDAWWRAANYLSVAQLYLRDDVLMRMPLEPADIKRRLLGHWGTVPALNLVYAHTNRLIVEHDLRAVYVCGPGHGGQAMIANAWLEGTYSELFPEIGRDEEGIRALCRRFSFPGGVASHAAPSTPGSINEGGELGYSLVHAAGAVLDNPDLVAVCVIGDGEAETATLVASWQVSRLLNPVTDGHVLPILNLNGWKIANPTLLARIPEAELRSLLVGGGWEPTFVSVESDDDHETVHRRMASAMDAALTGTERVRAHGGARPMIVLRSPKGWTGPGEVDGLQVEGTWRSHQIPLSEVREDEAHRRLLEEWLRSYRPQELFTAEGAPSPALDALRPVPERRISASVHMNGGVREPLRLPAEGTGAVDTGGTRTTLASATGAAGEWLADLVRRNPRTFRLFGADEVESNRLEAVLEVSPRQWALPIGPLDEHLAASGRVIELLSENILQGLAEGYALTGRHPLFTSYEAFIHIVDSMFNQFAKWIESAQGVSWREPIPAFTYLLSSHVWRQDHNGFSHQDPGFMDVVADKRPDLTRIYLPPDANTLIAVLERAMPRTDVVNLVIAGKNEQPAWLDPAEARRHAEAGIGSWAWAGTPGGESAPDVVLACAGDVPTIEAVAAAGLIRREAPGIEVRVVNIVDLMRVVPEDRHPHGLADERWEELFPLEVPVVMAFHGYPVLVHRLLHGRARAERVHVHGFQEKGTTTTPFDMLMLNDLDRYALAIDAVQRVAGDDPARAETLAGWQGMRQANRRHAYAEGTDLPEIENWRFGG